MTSSLFPFLSIPHCLIIEVERCSHKANGRKNAERNENHGRLHKEKLKQLALFRLGENKTRTMIEIHKIMNGVKGVLPLSLSPPLLSPVPITKMREHSMSLKGKF